MTAYTSILIVALISAGITWCWRALAWRQSRFDAPERRRLHEVPTARGGGIGPVAAWLILLAWPNAFGIQSFTRPGATGYALALLSVAAVGLIDDLRPLSARARLLVQIPAAAVLAMGFLEGQDLAMPWLVGIALSFAGVASINLHNFMDGLNGLLSLQAVFVLLTLAGFAQAHGDTDLSLAACLFATALIAFLPFNFPKASIFLGDVGSGAIGLVIGALSLTAIDHEVLGWGGVLILSSGFVLDAGATLLHRMHTTRLWFRPHRSHLFQWLRRRKFGIVKINLIYQGWNLLVVLPVLWFLLRSEYSLARELLATILVYGLGLILWLAARHALHHHHQAQYRS